MPPLVLLLALGQDPRPAMEASIARQREAVMAMRQSIDRQRAVVEAQAPPPRDLVMEPVCEPVPAGQIAAWTADAARREGLDPALLRAMARQESAFQPCAVSPKGAMGIMQLMPATAEQLGVSNPFDPRQSIEAGARLLKQLLGRFGGDLALALGAYNAGPGRVDAAGKVPEIPETLRYVDSILSVLP